MAEVPRLLVLDPGLPHGLAAPLDGPGRLWLVTWQLPAAIGWSLWLGAWLLVLPFTRRLTSTSPLARAGLAAALLAWVPYQGWIPAGELLAPRFLYLPLLLAGPWLGEVLVGAARRLPRPARAVAVGLTLVLLPVAAFHASRPYGSLEVYHQRWIQAAPLAPEGWNGLGLAREGRDDRAGARAAWERALEVAEDGRYGRAHSNLGRLALEDGDRERALEHFERAAELGPGNPVAWANLGRLQLDLGDSAGAAASYRRATSQAPGLATAWRGLARARFEQGFLAAARAALERAEHLAPEDPLTQATRALLEGAEP